jgi:hypothetical protein
MNVTHRLVLAAALAAALAGPVCAQADTAPIDAKVTSTKALEPKTHRLRDVGLIVGGAVVGHITSKRTGIEHGTLAGAAAGFALATSLKSDIDVKRGTIVHLKLNAPVVAST